MDQDAVIAAIIELARTLQAEELSESTISLTHPDLYDASLSACGGWDVALAEALRAVLAELDSAGEEDDGDDDDESERARPSAGAPLIVEREPHPEAMRPVVARTERGYVLATPARWFEASTEVALPRPLLRWPGDVGRPLGFRDLGDASGLAALADDGRLFGWDARLLPDAEVGEGARRLGATHGVERWVSVHDRDSLIRTAVVVTISVRGKVKASTADLLPNPVNADGTVVCLVDDGDALVGLVAAGLRDGLLLISSNGYGIHFAVEDVRPMGLRAAGVIGMKLRGDARVIGALVPGRHEEVAVISARGYAKRMLLEEFRPQSRAGLGLVAGKLARGDRLVSAVGITPPCDLLLTTSHGRCLRLPVEAFPSMGRPARGSRVLELDGGESVVGLAAMLPMAF